MNYEKDFTLTENDKSVLRVMSDRVCDCIREIENLSVGLLNGPPIYNSKLVYAGTSVCPYCPATEVFWGLTDTLKGIKKLYPEIDIPKDYIDVSDFY